LKLLGVEKTEKSLVKPGKTMRQIVLQSMPDEADSQGDCPCKITAKRLRD